MRNREVTKEWLMAHGGYVKEIVCEVCGFTFLDGAHYHPDHRLQGYDMDCCDSCYDANWDGWAPQFESKLLSHLKERGIAPPPKNEKGLLPREF